MNTTATATATSPAIPISTVALGRDVEALVLEVIRSGHLAQGPKVAALEAAFAAAHQVRHAVAVNNGTTALVASLQALELEPGDEVITSPFTFAATVNAIIEAGATVRFADIGDDFCLDPQSVAAVIGARTKVLMPVHLYGQPAAMAPIADLAVTHDLAIVEDAAQAHGAAVAGRPVGGWGLGCFSFYATKNITTGEGGMITTDDDALADRLRLLRNQGMRARYVYEIPGHNYRMTDLQAAIAIPQIAALAATTARRAANATVLSEGLAGLDGLVTPSVVQGRQHAWHQYTIRVGPGAPLTRDALVSRLGEHGVGTGVYYPRPVWDHDCYRTHRLVSLDPTPHCERIASEVLSLPVHPALVDADLVRIISVVRSAWAR
jgi:dTDP-4-amino-4,6-dideoxygalactose transaminase